MGEMQLQNHPGRKMRPPQRGTLASRPVAKFDAIKPNFAFQPGGGSVIKLPMQIIAACPRQVSAKLHLSSNGLRSFGPPAVVF
jgi:hypothetical protein